MTVTSRFAPAPTGRYHDRMAGSDGMADGQSWTRFWLYGVVPVVSGVPQAKVAGQGGLGDVVVESVGVDAAVGLVVVERDPDVIEPEPLRAGDPPGRDEQIEHYQATIRCAPAAGRRRGRLCGRPPPAAVLEPPTLQPSPALSLTLVASESKRLA